MTIRIGSPTTPRGITLGSAVANTLKIAGIAAVAYGAATGFGIFAELANHKEAASAIYHLMAPAVKLTNSAYGALANAAGLGQAVEQSPAVDQVVQLAGSGVMAATIGGVLSMVGAKLQRAIERHQENHRAEPATQPTARAAVSTLAGIKSRWTSGAPGQARQDLRQAPADVEASPSSPGMR